MSDFLLNLLRQHTASDGEPAACPAASQLLDMESSSALTNTGGARLAQHILNCADCANRWDIIQADPHVDLAELYALERLSQELFAPLRASQHLNRCSPCQQHEQALNNLVLVENPRSVHYGNLVTQLRHGVEPAPTLRAGEVEVLSAIVMRAKGEPYLRGNEIERVVLPVRRALLTEDGLLTIELQVPQDYSRAQLAVSTEGHSVMFPPTSLQQNLARFIAETRLRGAERKLSASQLSAWVTRP